MGESSFFEPHAAERGQHGDDDGQRFRGVRRGCHLGQAVRAAIQGGCNFVDLLRQLMQWLPQLSGILGHHFRVAGKRLIQRDLHVAVSKVFPLPYFELRPDKLADFINKGAISKGNREFVSKVMANIWMISL